MMQVEVRDHALWIKHIEGPPRTLEWLVAKPEGAAVRMVVAGVEGHWTKMQDGKDGRPTPGFRPADNETREHWHRLVAGKGMKVSLLVFAGD